MTDDHPETIRRLLEAIGRGAVEEAFSCLSPEPTVDADPWFGRPVVGREAIRATLLTFLHSLPGLKLLVRELYDGRSEAIAIVVVTATMAHLSPDPVRIPRWKGGQRLRWQGAFRFVFAPDGRVRSIHLFGDDRLLEWLPRAPEAPRLAAPSPGLEVAW